MEQPEELALRNAKELAQRNAEEAAKEAIAALAALGRRGVVVYLLAACAHGLLDRVSFVIFAFGMQPEFVPGIEQAARDGHWPVVDFCLSLDDPLALQAVERGASDAVAAACSANDESAVGVFLDRLGMRTSFMRGASIAARRDFKFLVKRFLKAGASIVLEGYESLLASAAKGGALRTLRMLINRIPPDSRHALINFRQLWMPLHAACWSGSVECVDLLLSCGADPDAPVTDDVGSKRPVHFAVESRSLPVLSRLFAAGANFWLGAVCPRDYAIHYAAGTPDNAPVLRHFLSAWPQAALLQDHRGQTPLMIACHFHLASNIEAILETPDPGLALRDLRGRTAHQLFCFRRRPPFPSLASRLLP